jgi:hypothetical protein
MKTLPHLPVKTHPYLVSDPSAVALLLVLLTAWAGGLLPSASAAPAPPHGIIAANIEVTINSFDNDTNAVTLTTPYRIGDFRVPYGNNGDYDVQIGAVRTNDVLGGILITSPRENGRDDNHPLFPGTNMFTTHVDYHRAGALDPSGEPIENSYWIPVSLARPNALGTTVGEWDANIAAAWFPYSQWIGAIVQNANDDNGGANDLLVGTPGLVLGTHFVDLGGGKAKVDLTSLGIDARTDGVLLVMGAKNEDNYGLSQVNTNDGTWTLFSKDNGSDGAGTEQDPLAFVFVPRSNTNVISGRFLGNGTITMFSGSSPQFTVTNLAVGTWELKIPGKSPRYGVLLVSPEGGLGGNQDNYVTYQVNGAGDGWIVQSWDLPSPVNATPPPPWFLPPLETPGDGTEPVADFVFIPGPTPGFTVTPTNNLYTTEGGGTAQFSVVLDTAPAADVTLNVSSDNTAEGAVSVSSLTFTPADWDVPQIITVTGQDDAVQDGPVTYHIVLSASTSADADFNGLNPADVTVINLDNETPITVVPVSGLTTTEAGGTATFDVVLNTAPAADVTIGLSSSDTTEGTVSPASLTFTTGNWNVVQTVTVTGVDDSVDDGDIAYTIVTAPAVSADGNFNGVNPPDVSVVNLDNDTAGLNVSAAGPGVILNVVEGQMTSYTVALNSQPTVNVTVNVASGNTAQGGTVSPASLTFTPANWNLPQNVSVSGVDDLVADGNIAWFITNSPSSGDPLYGSLAPVVVSALTLDNEPALTLPSGEVFYGAGAPAVGIDGRATLSDTNISSYNGVTLSVGSTSGGTADDRFEIRNTGSGPGEIGVSGSTVSYGGTAIGSFTGGVGTTALVVTFNSAATPTAAQAVLRSVTFRNVNSAPSLATRAVAVTLAHPDGGQATATTSVRVGPFRVADFQEGADHGYGIYTGQADIELFENQPDLAFPRGHSGTTNDPRMWVDARAAATTEEAQVLLRFDNIIGTGPGQIPPGARIVSAELLLRVIDQGDGSPLFRMKVPWNEESDSWLTFGNGIQIDDVEARTNYDSQIGVLQVSGDTGTGQITVGVTDDVQAWANGEPNYGWGMVSWDQDLNASWSRGTDGMAFRPSEAPNIDDRPRLRVIWVPTNTLVASFRQGVNGYTGAKDTRIRQGEPDATANTATIVFVDAIVFGSTNNPDQVLVRFDDIIGNNPGQVPPGSVVYGAVLDLATLGGNAYGDGGQFFAMFSPWQDTDTWNTLVNGIQTDGVEAASTPSASAGTPALNPNVCGGFMSFEVTSDVQAWVSGARPNYGWAILPWPGGGDGWGIAMSENTEERARPRLRVFYTPAVNITLQPPLVSPTSVQLNFTGAASKLHYVLRAPVITGPWATNGTATTDGAGHATYTDNSPLPGGAFYRVYLP